jgi:hypothetical protein
MVHHFVMFCGVSCLALAKLTVIVLIAVVFHFVLTVLKLTVAQGRTC